MRGETSGSFSGVRSEVFASAAEKFASVKRGEDVSNAAQKITSSARQDLFGNGLHIVNLA
jgi:hypothetical protein